MSKTTSEVRDRAPAESTRAQPGRRRRVVARPGNSQPEAAAPPSSDAGELAAELFADLEAARGRVHHPMEQRLFRKPCCARDAQTGRTCELLAGHPGGDPKRHRRGRTEFTEVAAEGQTFFSRRAELDARAGVRVGSLLSQEAACG